MWRMMKHFLKLTLVELRDISKIKPGKYFMDSFLRLGSPFIQGHNILQIVQRYGLCFNFDVKLE